MEVNYLGIVIAIFLVIFLIFMMPAYSNFLSQILILFQGNSVVAIVTIFAVLVFIFLGIFALITK